MENINSFPFFIIFENSFSDIYVVIADRIIQNKNIGLKLRSLILSIKLPIDTGIYNINE